MLFLIRELPVVAMPRISIDLLARSECLHQIQVLLPKQIAWKELLILFASGGALLFCR